MSERKLQKKKSKKPQYSLPVKGRAGGTETFDHRIAAWIQNGRKGGADWKADRLL